MKKPCTEHQIESLKTPCGTVYIMDEDGNRIPFSLRKNTFDCDYEFESSTGAIKIINTETNYDIVVSSSLLQLRKEYKIVLKGITLEYGASDERTVCVSGKTNGYCIALGAYLPNDDERMNQAYAYSERMGFLANRIIQEPPEFDESKFVQYDADMLEDYSGFRFHLIDYTCKEIAFPIAWIKSEPDDELYYQDAAEFWTT